MPRLPHPPPALPPRARTVALSTAALLAALMLAGCNSLPEVAMRETAAARVADYPQLAPLPELLARADTPGTARPAADAVTARAATLRNRAARLRQVPVGGTQPISPPPAS